MSLYQALPPVQGQTRSKGDASLSTPALASAPPAAPVLPSPSRVFLPRPPVPRALLSAASSKTKAAAASAVASVPGSVTAAAAPADGAPRAVAVSETVTVVPSLFELSGDDGVEGGEELLQALSAAVDVYDPRRPTEWEQYLAWRDQQRAEEQALSDTAALQSAVPTDRKRPREDDNGDSDEDDEEGERAAVRRSRRGGHQISFAYDYTAAASPPIHDPSLPFSRPPPPPYSLSPAPPPLSSSSALPRPPAPVTAPLHVKLDALAVASGEDAYMRRLQLSQQPRPAPPNPAPVPASLLPRPPPPPPSASASSAPPPPPPPSRVLLLTVAVALFTAHSPRRAPVPVPPLRGKRSACRADPRPPCVLCHAEPGRARRRGRRPRGGDRRRVRQIRRSAALRRSHRSRRRHNEGRRGRPCLCRIRGWRVGDGGGQSPSWPHIWRTARRVHTVRRRALRSRQAHIDVLA